VAACSIGVAVCAAWVDERLFFVHRAKIPVSGWWNAKPFVDHVGEPLKDGRSLLSIHVRNAVVDDRSHPRDQLVRWRG